jgi:hypothetical protein
MYVVRIGLCTLVETDADDEKDLLKKLSAALQKDTRVKDFVDLEPDKCRFFTPKIPASIIRVNRLSRGPESALAHAHAIEMNPPLQFTVQVPRRLQLPDWGKEDEVPSDEYWVTWDGIALAILWKLEGESSYGQIGGLSVINVLREAAKSSGCEVIAQPCGPNCNYLFAHRDVTVTTTADRDLQGTFEELDRWHAGFAIPESLATPYEAALAVHHAMGTASRWFALMRSEGKAISNIESSARQDLDDLLEIYHKTTLTGSLANPKNWKSRWKIRGWRREAKRLVARLWLALSALEARRHDWTNGKFVYSKEAATRGRSLIFKSEYDDEVNYISAIDVSSIESSVEYAASHLDTQSVVKATAISAIIGAIVGASITGFLQLGANQNNSAPTHSHASVSPSASPTRL